MAVKQSAYSTVIFDLNGVTFDIDKYALFKTIGITDTLKYLVTHRQNPIDRCMRALDTMHNDFPALNPIGVTYKGHMMPECICACVAGKQSNQQTVAQISSYLAHLGEKQFFASPLEQKMVTNIIKALFDAQITKEILKPINKTIGLAQQLKKNGYKLFLLSNLDSDTTHILQQSYPDFFALFSGTMLSCQEHLLKPDPAIFDLCLNRYNLDPKSCVFIDDQQENIVAAQGCGIKSVLFNQKTLEKNLRDLGIVC